jgi:hypothetical protein
MTSSLLMVALGCSAILSTGCAVRLQVQSAPMGAVLSVDGESVGVTPLEVRVPFRPFFLSPPNMRVTMPGHRPLEVALGREARLGTRSRQLLFHPLVALGIRGAPILDLLLIESHGPVGSWEVE